MFRVGKNSIDILPNLKRALDYSDRTFREMYISLGCALENLLIASKYFGISMEVNYLPEDDLENIAAKVMYKGLAKTKSRTSLLFPYITKRITNRTKYQDRPIPKDVLKEAWSLVDNKEIRLNFVCDSQKKDKIALLVRESSMFAFSDKYFKEELSRWVRPVYTNKPDGIALFGFGIPGPLTLFAEKFIKNLPPKMQANKDEEFVSTAPCVLIISSSFDNKESWLKVGRAYELVTLSLTKSGIACAPMAGVIEYEKTRKKLREQLRIKGMPMFFARIGYPSESVHSAPRISSTGVTID